MNNKAAILGGTPTFNEFMPLAKPTLPIYEELEEGFRSIFTTGMITKGKFLTQFEKEVENYLQVPHAVGVSNATTGLFMLIKALKLTGEVIVPSFSFMATFHVVELAGLTPVFVDCEKGTFTIDLQAVEEAITPQTSAIMGVTIFGNPPNMNGLENLAKKHNLKFIMDSAHSFGSLYNGKPMGSHGDGEVFSTSATKLLATGEGGVLTTRNRETADFIKTFREYGNAGDYDCEVAGVNGRMSEFHALLGLKILPKLEEFASSRNRIAKFYRENLMNIPGITFQKIRDGCRSSYKDFAIIIDEVQFGIDRNQVAQALFEEGIGTRKYFYPPGHLQKAYRKYLPRLTGELKNTEYISKHSLVLPLYSHMNLKDAEKIVDAVEKIYQCREEIARLNLECVQAK